MSNVEAHPAQVLCRGEGLPGPRSECAGGAEVELIEAREVPLGGPRAMTVRRTLPQRQRSLIGAWCFFDHYGPDDVAATGGMDVAPHPHTGLQTVSWLFDGAIAHIDSGGGRGTVLPGEINLMTAGTGICHSETSTQDTQTLHGVQLWLALPDAVRGTLGRAFEHFEPEPVPLARASAGDSDTGSSDAGASDGGAPGAGDSDRAVDGSPAGEALVFIGSLLGRTSPISVYSPLVGAQLRLEPGAVVDLAVDPSFEHGLLLDSGAVALEGVEIPRAGLAYTGVGSQSLRIANLGEEPALLVLIGGQPFGEEIVMWWNFVGRDSQEIARYRAEWEAHGERFGEVDGYVGHLGPGRSKDGLARLPAPALPDVELRPRRNPPPSAQRSRTQPLTPAPGGAAAETAPNGDSHGR